MDKREVSLNKIINHKQIRTVFQPIVSLKRGTVLGYEALSRVTAESEFNNPWVPPLIRRYF